MSLRKNDKKRKFPFGPVTGILAALILMLMLILGLIFPDKVYSETEKRTLAAFPSFNLQALVSGAYMSDLESYLADQFPMRDFAVKLASLWEDLTGPDISNNVLKGKEGWLFLLPSGEGHSSETEENLLNFLAAYDIRSTILLVPNAVSVAQESDKLSSLVPDGAVTFDQRVWYQNFYNKTEADAQEKNLSDRVSVLDPFDALTGAWESGEDVFYKTDHHWTTEGARTAYLLLKDQMGLTGNSESDVLVTACSNFSGSLISKSGFSVSSSDRIDILMPEEMVSTTVYYEEEQVTEAGVYSMEGLEGNDPYEVFFGGNHPLVRISSDAGTGRKLLVIKDSYANALVPFLIPDFDSIVMVDPRYYNGDMSVLMESENFTDLLVLYNLSTFCEDQALSMVLKEAESE